MLTKNNKTLAIKEITWDNVVDKLTSINPSLAAIMDKLKKSSNGYTFYLASYQFGSKIISDKKTFLPLENGDSIAFDDKQLPDSLLEDLKYDSITEDPLGIILNKTSEFYLMGENRIQPHGIITPGQMFGIPRAIDNSPNTSSVLELNLNAGCRSIFMLPKIGDQINHNRLQEKYDIKSAPPTSPQEHWNVFVELSKQVDCPWRSEIIYFPRNWINNLKNEEWAALEICLIHLHRKSYSIWHKVSDIWDKAFHEIEQEKLLNKHYPMQSLITSKQLFKITADVIPGFRPATSNESAPISLLAEMYSNTYNKLAKIKYKPIIMEPCKFKSQNEEPIYYSLNYATFTENHLESSKKKSQIALLEEIRTITELYSKGIIETKRDIKSLYDIANNVTFTYYHTNPENYNHIKNITLLAEEDKRLAPNENEEFPNNASFFKGCIKISKLNV